MAIQECYRDVLGLVEYEEVIMASLSPKHTYFFVCNTRNVLTICAFAQYVDIELRQGEGGAGQRQEPETGGEGSGFVRETAKLPGGWSPAVYKAILWVFLAVRRVCSFSLQ